MANQGAKKRVEENAKRMRTLRIVFIVGLCALLLARVLLLVRGKSTSAWLWVGSLLSLATNWFMYSSIAGFAAPSYGADGELIDGGSDLSMGGMCSYYHDILYVSVFVQVRLHVLSVCVLVCVCVRATMTSCMSRCLCRCLYTHVCVCVLP